MAPSYSHQLLDGIGLRELNHKELILISRKYRSELLAGLKGRSSSLKTLPSQLASVNLDTLSKEHEALVLEIGGTNLYGARIRVRDHRPVITSSYKSAFKRTIFNNTDDFFSTVIQELSPVLKEDPPDAIGIVYSFAGKSVRTRCGVDIYSDERLTKEFVIPGISHNGVGVAFMQILKRFYPNLVGGQPIVVLNDTVATLFSSSARIGGVVGTGFNLAFETPMGIINSESGSFTGIPIHTLSEYVNQNSLDTLGGLAEKQVSGVYLGQQFKRLVELLQIQEITGTFTKLDISSETLSELLEYTGKDNSTLILKEGAKRLRNRSAQIVGIMIATVIRTFPKLYNLDETEKVPIEGSVFWGMPGYRDEVLKVVKIFARDQQIQFLDIPDAGRLGAGIAALGVVS